MKNIPYFKQSLNIINHIKQIKPISQFRFYLFKVITFAMIRRKYCDSQEIKEELHNFVLVWLYKYFDMSVTGESDVDETRVWRTKL